MWCDKPYQDTAMTPNVWEANQIEQVQLSDTSWMSKFGDIEEIALPTPPPSTVEQSSDVLPKGFQLTQRPEPGTVSLSKFDSIQFYYVCGF